MASRSAFIREALGALGGQVQEVRLGGRGAPRAYRYGPEVGAPPTEPEEEEDALLIVEELPELMATVPAEKEEVLTW